MFLFNLIIKHSIIIRKIRSKFVSYLRNKSYYYRIYISYWHSRYALNNNYKNNQLNFYSAMPNPGAGIGHQMANWIAGHWFSKQFGLNYAYSPFSSNQWDSFLGFGQNEIAVSELLKVGYKKVRLPLFDEYNSSEVDLQKRIIKSYSNKKVIFITEQDQEYHDQFGVAEYMRQKFYNASARNKDQLFFDKKFLNISIHLRRGDIIIGKQNKNPNLLLRWQGNEYFVNVLRNVLANLKTDKPIAIYLFSQGKIEDFRHFNQFENIEFCLDVCPIISFLHMVFADVLITSKSSFSYKPALLNKNLKVCPKEFWHGYPNTNDWVMADETGTLLNKIKFYND